MTDVGLIEVFGSNLSPGAIRDYAQAAEALGYESLWAADHVVLFTDYPRGRYPYRSPHSRDGKLISPPGWGLIDPLFICQFVAAHTSTLRLGTQILLAAERNPVVLAKEIACLDHLSGGRFSLGVGTGWSPEEYEACGVAWEERGERLDEFLQVARTLWSDDGDAEFNGRWTRFAHVQCWPKPAQRPHPPIFIGGATAPAIRRAARYGTGWCPWDQTLGQLEEGRRDLDAQARSLGRDPAELDVQVSLVLEYMGESLPEQADAAAEYLDGARKLGLRRVLIQLVPLIGDGDPQATLSLFADRLGLKAPALP